MVGRKLEAVQDRIGRKLLGASNTVAGVAVRGDLGWRRLEERREEKEVLFGRRMGDLGEERLAKWIVEKLQETGGAGWREEYEVLTRKYGLEQEDEGQAAWSAAEWKRPGERNLPVDDWKISFPGERNLPAEKFCFPGNEIYRLTA